MGRKLLAYKIGLVLSYAIMIFFNVLANTLPLGGRTTGDISETYNTLFTPSGITFSIWGLIYVALFFLTLHWLRLPKKQFDKRYQRIITSVIITSLLNSGWLLAWHYDWIILSTFIMIALLIILGMSYRLVKRESIIESLTISLYIGWISIALIANIAITLVSLGVNPFTTFALILTNIILIVGALLVYYMISTYKDSLYPIVFSWAYLGIFIRHITGENLNTAYLSIIIISGSLSIVFLLTGMVYFNANKHYLRENH